jgi:glycosyltransferase involved in cell wall biosynthesis
LRILRIITRLNRGGPATNVAIASRGLDGRGFRTLVVHGSLHRGEASIPAEALEGIETLHLPELVRPVQPGHDLLALAKLAAIARRFRPHLIHTHLSKAGTLGRLVARFRPGTPTVHTFHGIVASEFFSGPASRVVVATERFLARRTSALVAISQTQRDELLHLRIGRDDQIHVLELAIETSQFRAANARGRAAARRICGVGDDEVAIVYSGRLVAVKRVDWLIAAATPVLLNHPKSALYIVGDGEERKALEEVARSAGSDRVRFVGWGNSIADWYAAADIVALGSRWEGTPLAVIEAMATGRAVVCTDVGGVRDIIRDGENGYVVPVNDQAEMTAALERLVTDEKLRERMAAAADRIAARFSAERLVGELETLYRGLIVS